MNEFTTVFEISSGSNGIRAQALLRFVIGVVTLVIGLIGLVRSKKSPSQERRRWKGPAFLIFWAGVWLLVHFPYFVDATARMSRLIEASRTGQCKSVDGVVHVTHEQPENGHASGDKITVGNQNFLVDFYKVTPGYRQTISHGGALREGVHARLHYLDGVILKVEVREPTHASKSDSF